MAVQAARWGGQRAELNGYSPRVSTQEESWITALNLTKLGQKTACQENTLPLIRKSYSLFLGMTVKKGIADDNDNDDD
jgi:hypothetical protein